MDKLRRIAFCTTCKDRTPHLKKTLAVNLADAASYPNAKFIVLDYNSKDDLLEYLSTAFPSEIASGRLVVYSYRDHPKFRMAHAKNMAHRLGIIEGGEILVNMDADNYAAPGFCEYINAEFEKNENAFLWSRMIREGPMRLQRGISGRIIVTAHAFIGVGGYDEQFATWGPDDKDFNVRLHRLGYERVEIDHTYLKSIQHTEKLRFREYPEAQASMADESFSSVLESDSTVVNFGNIGCGTVFRNFEETNFVHVTKVPTRIFGIGMHKTATTSLHSALKILGFNSAHWKSAHWAKAIYDEMVAGDRSLTLERSYALCDIPIPMLYDRLDRAYPGSKFILTVRDEAAWLKSVENHWSYDHNPYRGAWNEDPFTHRVHKILYGQKNFNAEIFLKRYRQHNGEVCEYFAGRTKDLLVMNMDAGAGWPELCGFLNRQKPDVEYPKAFATVPQVQDYAI